MKTIPEQYQCEVCNRRYLDKEEAKECENKGDGPDYPIGLIYGNHTKDSMYNNITFAIAEKKHFCHSNESSKWACRDNGAGDSLDKYMCGNSSSNHLNDYDAKLNFEHPTFKRMVKYLKDKKIPITVWDGKKPISLKEALEK